MKWISHPDLQLLVYHCCLHALQHGPGHVWFKELPLLFIGESHPILAWPDECNLFADMVPVVSFHLIFADQVPLSQFYYFYTTVSDNQILQNLLFLKLNQTVLWYNHVWGKQNVPQIDLYATNPSPNPLHTYLILFLWHSVKYPLLHGFFFHYFLKTTVRLDTRRIFDKLFLNA